MADSMLKAGWLERQLEQADRETYAIAYLEQVKRDPVEYAKFLKSIGYKGRLSIV